MSNTIPPHHLTNFIPAVANNIIGRTVELHDTFAGLHAGKPLLLFNGVGGIGKTTVAREYMALHQADYAHHAWLTAAPDVMSAFLNNLILLKNLQITEGVKDILKSGGGKAAQEAAFYLVLNTLQTLGKTLIVVDNANDLNDLIHIRLLLSNTRCHILVTSRVQPEGWQHVAIKPLSESDAVAVFRKYHSSVIATDDDILRVVRQLFRHTLLIELVAKAAQVNRLSFPSLVQALNHQSFHDAALNRLKIDTGEHGDSLADNFKRANVEEYIWAIFKTITQLPESAQQVLRALALLPTATTFRDDFLIKHLKLFDLTEEIPDTLHLRLYERGWLDAGDAEEGVSYQLHPLLADVIIQHLDVHVDYADKYIQHMANLIYYDNTDPNDNLFAKKPYEPLAERLVVLFFDKNTEGVLFS